MTATLTNGHPSGVDLSESTPWALHTRFLRGLAANPGSVAVQIGQRPVSYAELHETALRIAAAIPNRGTVGVLADRSLLAYAGLLAALYTGSAVVPLHPSFPAVRTQYMIDAAVLTALVVDDAGAQVLSALDVAAPVVGPEVPHPPSTSAPLPVDAADPAYILFTSGSTGRPKGVPITHGNTHHYFQLLDARYDFGPDDAFSQTFDLNFDCAMLDVFCAWNVGASVHPVPATAYRDLPAFVAQRGLTVWFSTPSAIAMARRLRSVGPGALPSLRWSLFAGEALRVADAQEWLAAADRSTLDNIYGPTELTVTITGHRFDPATSPGRAVNGLVPIGGVHAGHRHILLDPDGQVSRTEGELCIAGPQLTPGYLDRRDDAGRFLLRDGLRFYRTGDRVRRHADGELVYLGRQDSQVQIHGWRVELPEIEHALRGCAGVVDAVAVAVPSAVDGQLELVVYYTGIATGPARLAAALATVLPSGMLPRRYEYMEVFPLNTNRKIDRGRLATAAASAL